MADTYTWLQFSSEELDALRSILTNGVSYLDPNRELILNRIDQYTCAETTDQRFRDAAPNREGECEIDDYAVVSQSEDGAYVMAWVWVDRTEVEPDYVATYLREKEEH